MNTLIIYKMNINELINSSTGSEIINNITQKFGINQNEATAALTAAVPMILGGLGRNAQSADGAQSIENALQQHNPNRLNDIQGFFNMGDAAQKDGEGILGHIFGNNKEKVESGIAQKSGLSMSKIAPIIAMVAPLVLSYLSKQKQSNTQSGGGITDILGSVLGGGNNTGSKQGGIMGMVTGFLDKDGDGDVLDDLMGMFKK